MKSIDLRVWLALGLCAFGCTACEVEFTGDETEDLAPEAPAPEDSPNQDPPPGRPPDQPNSGFLWKPVSDSDGMLVILLPAAYSGGRVSRCEIHRGLPPTTATFVEAGRYTGDHNGNRPHYRFRHPGAAYGNNVHVVARFPDNTYKTWLVSDGSKRTVQ